MTDYSSWTDEQVNEAIFKAKGWEKLPPPAFPEWQRPTKIGVGTWWFKNIPDYTHSWELCGELLEEMQPADVDLMYFMSLNKWGVDWLDNDEVEHELYAPTPKRAICEAWLAWKEQG